MNSGNGAGLSMGSGQAGAGLAMADPFQYARRTLLPLEHVAIVLGCTVEEVTHLAESSRLRWSFDLAQTGSRRRDLRVWRGSLRAHQNHGRDTEDWEEVLRDILPRPTRTQGRLTIRGTELAWRFFCSQRHITHLRQGQELQVACPSGRNISPYFDYAGVCAFLRRRAL